MDPADFLARLDPSLGKPDDAINARIAAVHKKRRGPVISHKDGSTKPLAEFESAEELRKALLAGAVWLDAQASNPCIPRFAGISPVALQTTFCSMFILVPSVNAHVIFGVVFCLTAHSIMLSDVT